MKADDHDQSRRFERYYDLIAAVYDAAHDAVIHRLHGGTRVLVTPRVFRARMRQIFGACHGEPVGADPGDLFDPRDVSEWEGHTELRASVLAAMLCNIVGDA